MLKNKLEGIGWFTFESLKRIVKNHPEHTFYFIFDRKPSDEFIFGDNVTPIVTSPQARHPFLYYIWYEYSLPRILKKISPDVFISPDAITSLKCHFPNLVVLHDLNFVHYPEVMPLLFRKYYRYYTPKFAKKATRIATVSHFSKEDIIKQYNIPESKIDVVYNGSGNMYSPVSDNIKEDTRKKYTNGEEFFIFIGALNPRKNLSRIFKAFDLFKINTHSPVKFIVVGEKMYWSEDIKEAYEKMEFKNDVIFTGRLKQSELSLVLASAKALVFTSLLEGFGIPIIEAFNAEVPVITSNLTSMPEIADDAALLVDPLSIEEIANAMLTVYENQNLVEEMIKKGRTRRKDFSWDKTAEELWNSIIKTVKQKPY